MPYDYVQLIEGDEAEAWMKQTGNWTLAHVVQDHGWPETVTLVTFRGYRLALLPAEKDLYPAIALHNFRGRSDDGHQLLMEFASNLAWTGGRKIQIVGRMTGSRPFREGRSIFGQLRSMTFRIPYMPDPRDTDGRLALALYREGLGLDHPGYALLSFFKIINLRYRKGHQQRKFIARVVPQLKDRDSTEKLANLQKEMAEPVDEYLYLSCRNAVAHAGLDPTMNPDDLGDTKRFRTALPVVKALAAWLIENELGIKSLWTVLDEHAYELEGFRDRFGAELSQRLKNGEPVFKRRIPLPKLLSIRLLSKPRYGPFERMNASIEEVSDGVVFVRCISPSGLTHAELVLNFKAGRMGVDQLDGVEVKEDGSPEAAEEFAETWRFAREQTMNGELEIWDPESETCLGRCDALIPVNIDMGGTARNFRANEDVARSEAARRRDQIGTTPSRPETTQDD